MKFTGTIDHNEMLLTLPEDQGTLKITDKLSKETPETAVTLFFKDGQLVSTAQAPGRKSYDRCLTITPPKDITPEGLLIIIQDLQGVQATAPAEAKLAMDQSFKATLQLFLNMLGYPLTAAPTKKGPTKARHRWSKAVSAIPFTVAYNDSHATVYWQKRNEMLIKAGAQLKETAPRNKDGSVSLAERFGNKLREENLAAIADFTTTEDIILKSVNEVGLFLYFGGTNSWLQLLDDSGKSINEWTVIE